MKRFLAIFLVLLLFAPIVVQAEESNLFIDTIENIQQLSFSDLQSIDMIISQEMSRRPEWESVTVPPGVYQIGVDIPAGHWNISTFQGENDYYIELATIDYCTSLDESKTTYKSGSNISYLVLDSNEVTRSIYLKNDNWLIIRFHAVVFTPYTRPTLGY